MKLQDEIDKRTLTPSEYARRHYQRYRDVCGEAQGEGGESEADADHDGGADRVVPDAYFEMVLSPAPNEDPTIDEELPEEDLIEEAPEEETLNEDVDHV
jgi:hypothetical protein